MTVSNDDCARVWDTTNGKCLHILKHDSSILNAQISNNVMFLITLTADCKLQIYHIKSGEKIMDFNGHKDIILTAAISPKDLILLTASRDSTAILWNFENGEKLFDLVGHNLSVNLAIFNNDGTQAYTGSSDLSCRIWCTLTGVLCGVVYGNRKITSIYVDDFYIYTSGGIFNKHSYALIEKTRGDALDWNFENKQ